MHRVRMVGRRIFRRVAGIITGTALAAAAASAPAAGSAVHDLLTSLAEPARLDFLGATLQHRGLACQARQGEFRGFDTGGSALWRVRCRDGQSYVLAFGDPPAPGTRVLGCAARAPSAGGECTALAELHDLRAGRSGARPVRRTGRAQGSEPTFPPSSGQLPPLTQYRGSGRDGVHTTTLPARYYDSAGNLRPEFDPRTLRGQSNILRERIDRDGWDSIMALAEEQAEERAQALGQAASAPATQRQAGRVRRSESGFCHEPDSPQYDAAGGGETYPTMEACMASGGIPWR